MYVSAISNSEFKLNLIQQYAKAGRPVITADDIIKMEVFFRFLKIFQNCLKNVHREDMMQYVHIQNKKPLCFAILRLLKVTFSILQGGPFTLVKFLDNAYAKSCLTKELLNSVVFQFISQTFLSLMLCVRLPFKNCVVILISFCQQWLKTDVAFPMQHFCSCQCSFCFITYWLALAMKVSLIIFSCCGVLSSNTSLHLQWLNISTVLRMFHQRKRDFLRKMRLNSKKRCTSSFWSFSLMKRAKGHESSALRLERVILLSTSQVKS